MEKVFVGGTGRSGTTILSRWLGSQKPFIRFPCEARFHIDADGVLSLFNALTRDYSADQARIACRRFFQLMRVDLAARYTSPYQGFDLNSVVGSLYENALSELEKEIVLGRFHGWDFHTSRRLPKVLHKTIFRVGVLAERLHLGQMNAFRQMKKPMEDMYVCPHLEVAAAEEIFGRFLDVIFSGYAEKNGASGWTEDTPANSLHASFLLSLFPDAKHLCVIRNPYGTTLSYMRQIWAPSDFKLSVRLLASIYKKIIDELESMAPEKRERTMVVRLEDLHKDSVQDRIITFAGGAYLERKRMIKIKEVSMENERAILDNKGARYIDEKLGFVNRFFGYSID